MQESAEEIEAPTQIAFWRELVLAGAVVLAGFLAVDVWLRASGDTFVAEQIFDPQSPTVLHAKLDLLRRHPGFKVAVIGDSLILGLSLKEHGDVQWREHSLPRLLKKRLDKLLPDGDVLVMNLGMNGALPLDLAHLARQLRAVKPDLVICDIGLRAFSDDFNGEAQALSRPWLGFMGDGAHGQFGLEPTPEQTVDQAERQASAFCVNHWKSYALRDTLQHTILGDTPKSFCERCRELLRSRLQPGVDNGGLNKELAELQLLMKARSRFGSIHLQAGHRQRQGLEQLLSTANGESWRLLLFYARENPEVRDDLLPPEAYEKLRRDLKAAIEPFLRDSLRYHEGAEGLLSKNYLDHVHVDADGYEILLESLWPDVRALVQERRPR